MAIQGKRPKAKNQRWFSKKLVFLVILFLLVIAAIWFFHSKHTTPVATTGTTTTQSQQNGKSTGSSQQASEPPSQPPPTETNKVPTSSGATNQTGQPVESPGTYSTFVNASPLSLNEAAQTVCVTTPGAACEVEFQMDSTTKVLPAQTTDSTGSAYFNWTPKKAGLSPGNWTIILKVSMGSTTKTAQDSQTLQVTQ